ncbi:MAG: glycosyltransferase family 2 protein [bacterium]|nr:glycosyltransferase family 2 protein [bacterium]
MYKDKKISIVTPCYNEEDGIKIILEKIPDIVDEVVVVDNNCTDNTVEVAKSFGDKVVIVREEKKGYGIAYKAGFKAATGDVIVTMDADGTYPPESISLLLYILFEEKVDFITARRWHSKSGKSKSFLRVFGNIILSTVLAALFLRVIVDSQSGMWVFKKEVLDRVKLTSNGMAFSQELKIEAFTNRTIEAIEIPIYYGERVGESKLNLWSDGFGNLLFLFKKRIMDRRIL